MWRLQSNCEIRADVHMRKTYKTYEVFSYPDFPSPSVLNPALKNTPQSINTDVESGISKRFLIRICAAIMGVSGLAIIIASTYPLVSYQWESAIKYPVLISSLVDEEKASFKFVGKDYTRISNWIDSFPQQEAKVSDKVRFYTISIPKLKIQNATVSIGGENLEENLIQYSQTALPGKVGNSVIFGHSILPTFYDPKNYLAIFSTLFKLEVGDEVFVDYDGITYRYMVEDLFEVKPKDIQILEQNSDSPYLTLVTCTPPGHPLKPKRLIVRARLIPQTGYDSH